MKNKFEKIALSLLIIPLVLNGIEAATTYIGGGVNVTQLNGTTVSTGSGATDSGTQRFVLSTNSPAQTIATGTNNIGTVTGSTVTIQGSGGSAITATGGSLNMNMTNAVPTGTNNIGTISGSTVVLQGFGGAAITATGGALNVNLPNALPTGTNSIGQVSEAVVNGAGTVTAVGYGVGQSSVPVNIMNTASTLPGQLSTVNKSSQTVGAVSVQMFAANANRRGIECTALPGNTDWCACSFSGTAVITDSIIITQAGSWTEPVGLSATNALSCICNSGSQVIRCTEYATP